MINIRGNEIDEEKVLGVQIKTDSMVNDSSATYYILEVLTQQADGSEKTVDILFGNEAGVKTAYNTIQMHTKKMEMSK